MKDDWRGYCVYIRKSDIYGDSNVTTFYLSRTIGAIALGAAFLAATPTSASPGSVTGVEPPIPAAVRQLDRRVTVVNRTRYTIMELYASNVGENDWQEDMLGRDVLPAGRSVRINIDDGTGYCLYDFKGVFEDGDVVSTRRVNVCEVSTFTFTE